MYRKIGFPLLFLLLSGQLWAQGITFYIGPYSGALEKASRENKLVMVDAYTDWCGWCKVMDRETFSVDSVGAFFDKHFICIKINMEEGEGVDLAKKFRINSFPTYLFLDQKGRPLMKSQGYQVPGEFLKTGRKVLEPENHMQYPGKPDKMDPGFPEFYHNAFKTGKDRKYPENEQVAAYLEGMSEKDLMKEPAWSVMWRFETNEKFDQFFLENREEYERQYGKTEVMEKLGSLVFVKWDEILESEETGQIKEVLKWIDKNYPESEREITKIYGQQYVYTELADWENLAKVSLEMFNKTGTQYHNMLNSTAWDIAMEAGDPKILDGPKKWMKQVVEDFPADYSYLDTYAWVLYQAGDVKQAEKWAKKALQVGKDSVEKTGSTDRLLEKINGEK